ICRNCEEKRGMKIMIKYEIKPVVCDYGIFENGELKLILNCMSNAQTIVNILNADLEKKEYAVLMKREINIEKESSKIEQYSCWGKYGKSLNSGIKCSNCGREL
ncbi:hypothetical protein, partial [Clostridium paraputrificum]|uniref:hypothetical protein n=1 Tax=Clostridium paraputrificum TaxID=29363 RepID=UPI001A9A4234